jgi:hypothetical protein
MVYNEKANVDSKFDVVADIVHDKGNVHIKVKVVVEGSCFPQSFQV